MVAPWFSRKPESVYLSEALPCRAASSPQIMWLVAFSGAANEPVSRFPAMAAVAAVARPAAVPDRRARWITDGSFFREEYPVHPRGRPEARKTGRNVRFTAAYPCGRNRNAPD